MCIESLEDFENNVENELKNKREISANSNCLGFSLISAGKKLVIFINYS